MEHDLLQRYAAVKQHVTLATSRALAVLDAYVVPVDAETADRIEHAKLGALTLAQLLDLWLDVRERVTEIRESVEWKELRSMVDVSGKCESCALAYDLDQDPLTWPTFTLIKYMYGPHVHLIRRTTETIPPPHRRPTDLELARMPRVRDDQHELVFASHAFFGIGLGARSVFSIPENWKTRPLPVVKE